MTIKVLITSSGQARQTNSMEAECAIIYVKFGQFPIPACHVCDSGLRDRHWVTAVLLLQISPLIVEVWRPASAFQCCDSCCYRLPIMRHAIPGHLASRTGKCVRDTGVWSMGLIPECPVHSGMGDNLVYVV
jgi:hypothetical protein